MQFVKIDKLLSLCLNSPILAINKPLTMIYATMNSLFDTF